ncbi:MAG: substrate-binding domain-containing protein [Acidobacteriota bacterium]|nr:substrate-binding domain-containing protein [Acidobacteriota bacterium]MDE3107446.1 substrate-binding domain-containing protein [Acidobacteriota bacterium]MDE3222229.1 substrate-binding domain-containing protein [Acidobacteriota bacterium]
MASLKSITAKGKGSIAVILPDTVSSTRYTEFDAPYLKKAFLTAGLKSSQFIIQNAQGSTTTQYTDAQADISKGAKVILLDALDSTTGSQIEKYAKAHGVKVIDYDRLVLGGSDGYYVSFNNVAVGTLIGQGLVSCLTSWKVKSPMVYEMKGDPTDNNATLFAQGYSAVLTKAGFTTAKGNLTVQGTGTWTPATALTDFQGVYSSNAKINAVVTPNDENAAPIISYLQSKGLAPKTIPFTGQDATLTGFQNIISGYQCGTVYKPVWLEAQAAAALAVYLRAGMAAPKSLVNGVTKDSTTMKNVPSVLLKATWVTAATVEKTVIADKVIKASDLCTATAPNVAGSTQPTYAQDCKTYGIK